MRGGAGSRPPGAAPVSTEAPTARPGSKDALVAARFNLLGKVPDHEIARLAGVSVRTVASYRTRHGIAGFRAPVAPKPVSAPPAAAPPAAPAEPAPTNGAPAVAASPVGLAPTGEVAWRVSIGVGDAAFERIVVGDSVAAAAERALAHAAREHAAVVTHIARLGDVLG